MGAITYKAQAHPKQTEIYFFDKSYVLEPLDPCEYYERLRSSGRLNTQRGLIFQLLMDGKPHAAKELSEVSLQYNARVYELKQEGFLIENLRDPYSNITYFRLIL